MNTETPGHKGKSVMRIFLEHIFFSFWKFSVFLRKLFAIRGRDLQDIHTYCMFIGYPRSGHSFLGVLMDAHPRIIISHELDVLRFIKHGFTKKALLPMILMRSRRFSKTKRGNKSKFRQVPGQWNGRYERLEIIGDKKGGQSTRSLSDHPELFDMLQSEMGIPIKIIHLTRNPFDNIATISRVSGRTLEDAIEYYRLHAESVSKMKVLLDETMMLDLSHEDLIANPEKVLSEICNFLQVDVSDEYLSSAAGLVFTSPNMSRMGLEWDEEHRTKVAEIIQNYQFLNGYTF